MLPTKCKADQSCADQAAKRGLSAVEDLFTRETLQFEAEARGRGAASSSLAFGSSYGLSSPGRGKASPQTISGKNFTTFKLLIW